jgi:hypothetical protein
MVQNNRGESGPHFLTIKHTTFTQSLTKRDSKRQVISDNKPEGRGFDTRRGNF